jgi:rhodanese-related sulfurtransferase
MGMTPNPDFLRVMQSAFPKDARLIVSCKAGGRSARAAALLEEAGFTNVADQTSGYEGKPDPQTGALRPGWRPGGFPVSREAAAGHAYADLEKKTQ